MHPRRSPQQQWIERTQCQRRDHRPGAGSYPHPYCETVEIRTATRSRSPSPANHAMMVARHIQKIAPQAAIFDCALLPEHISRIGQFIVVAHSAYARMLADIAFWKLTGQRSTEWVFVNAWAIYDRRSEWPPATTPTVGHIVSISIVEEAAVLNKSTSSLLRKLRPVLPEHELRARRSRTGPQHIRCELPSAGLDHRRGANGWTYGSATPHKERGTWRNKNPISASRANFARRRTPISSIPGRPPRARSRPG